MTTLTAKSHKRTGLAMRRGASGHTEGCAPFSDLLQRIATKHVAVERADKKQHDPRARASGNPSKLTDDEVREARHLYDKGGMKVKDLAEKFGTTRPYMANVVYGYTHRFVI